jgi:hypothetical protein
MHDRDSIILDHLDRMTDSTGLIQHAIYSVPRRESGYTTDDNARALRLCTRLWQQNPDQRMLDRVAVYLSFIEYARCGNGGFHNFLSYQRHWLDVQGTGDCQGQAIRSLAEVLGSNLPDGYRSLAREMIEGVFPTLIDLRSLRAQAYVILASAHLWTAGVREVELLENVAWFAARRLIESYRRICRPDWPWFESRLTYANAVLPHALFLAARRWPNESFLEVAEETFAFLDKVSTEENFFCPVGNNGWYRHGEDKARFDQQPIEAAMQADAALTAFGLLGEEKYLAAFYRAHGWFHGENSLRQPLVDIRRGACFDGLHASGVNRNQGAESTLAFLSAEVNNSEVRKTHLDGRKDATRVSPAGQTILLGR